MACAIVLLPFAGLLPAQGTESDVLPGGRRLVDGFVRVQAIRGLVLLGVDTNRTAEQLYRHGQELDLVLAQATSGQAPATLRSMHDTREEVDRVRKSMDRILAGLGQDIDRFGQYRQELIALSPTTGDSVVPDGQGLYGREHALLQGLAKVTLLTCDSVLDGIMVLHERALRYRVSANGEYDRLGKAMLSEEQELVERRYPPVWLLGRQAMSPLGVVWHRTWSTTGDALAGFAKHFWKQLIILRLAVLLLALLPLWYVRRELRSKADTPYSPRIHFLRRYPMEIGAIVVLVLVPLLFTHTPRVVIDGAFVGMLFPVVRIFLRENPALKRWHVLAVLAYYIVLKCTNALVEVTVLKRMVLLAAIATVPLLLPLVRYMERSGFRYLGLVRSVFVLLLCHIVVGWLMAALGWVRLGTNLITVGFDSFYLATALYMAVLASYEYLLLLADRHHRHGGTVELDLFKARPRILRIQVVIAVVIWAFDYLNGMDLWELIRERSVYAITEPRSFMGVHFSWQGVSYFLACIMITLTITRLLSDLFDVHGSDGQPRRHGGALLLRLMVLFCGFLLALSTTGITMDRMMVVLGALGVGIGFGLQNLMNNLVSGIMLALEHPIRSGDVIQLADATGTVMDIGIRSTRLRDQAGAVLIIPNSKLISDPVRNRTFTHRSGQVAIKLSVPATNDLGRVLAIVQQVSAAQTAEGQHAPTVYLSELGRYWAELTVTLWVHDVDTSTAERGALLAAIAKAFTEAGIDLGNTVARDT